jgi:L-gulonolactone oxidase
VGMDGSSDKSRISTGACTQVEIQNWKGSITYTACHKILIHSVEQIQSIVANPAFPSPVRAKGSHHSTTMCIVAEAGTVLDFSQFNAIAIDERARTITMQAGALLFDAAKKLAEKKLQFYVNIELGNLTAGSGGCCATKEASFYSNSVREYEYGQVSSYAIGFKTVQADGTLLTVDEENNPELLPYMRSSYGLLGIVYEVTFEVKPRIPMRVAHEAYDVKTFAAQVGAIVKQNRSTMLYLFPHLDRVVVERRWEESGTEIGNRILWRIRNFVWMRVSPWLGHTLRLFGRPGYALIDVYYTFLAWALATLFHARRTDPKDQIIKYPKHSGYGSYTFSIWAFRLEDYPRVLLEYFELCKAYFDEHGFRCDMLNVGYAEAQDNRALFSYTRDGFSLTLDPVNTGSDVRWDAFLKKFNEFCSENGGKPLLNQTPHLEPIQVQRAFGPQIAEFQRERLCRDPGDRFYNEYFRKLFL